MIKQTHETGEKDSRRQGLKGEDKPRGCFAVFTDDTRGQCKGSEEESVAETVSTTVPFGSVLFAEKAYGAASHTGATLALNPSR